MRKLMMWLLCLMLLAALPLALTEGSDDDLLQGQRPESLVRMDGTLYLLLRDEAGQQVSRFDRRQQPQPWLKLRAEDAIDHLLAEDGQLYGFHHESGRVCRLNETGLSWLSQALDTSAYRDARYFPAMAAPILEGGHVYRPLLLSGAETEFNELALAAHELSTGSSRVISTEGALAFAPYKPGKLLVLRFVKRDGDSHGYQLAELDLKGGSLQPLPMAMPEALPYSNPIGAIGYDAVADRLYYADARQLMASTGQKPFERVGLLPFEGFSQDTAQGFPLDSGYAVFSGGRLVFRQSDKVIDMVELSIQGHGNSAALARLRQERPDILPVLRESELSAAEAYTRIQGGDQETDIYILRVDSAFRALIDKGYAMDLSGDPLLQAEAARLAPVFQQALQTREGRLSAWPVQMSLMSTTLKRAEWQSMTGDAPHPATWGQLVQAFQLHAVGDHAGEPFFAYAGQEEVVQQILRSYILRYERPDEALHFQRSSLREALEGLATACQQQPAAGQQDADDNETGSSDYLVFLNGSASLFEVPGRYDDGTELLKPFVFEKGEQPQWELGLRAAIINPHSRQKEAALQYLHCLMQKDADPQLYYASRPDAADPYLDPDYEHRLSRTKEQLTAFEESLKKAEAGEDTGMDIHFLRQRMEWAKADLADTDRLKWLIPAEGIAAFREKAGWLTTADRSLLLSDQAFEQVKGLVGRYSEGSLSLDALLQELDQLARLVHLEQR